jgi:hypothetical protein
MTVPPMDRWVTNRVRVDELSGWLWVDDEAPQEDLQAATAEQVQRVLARISGFRIAGEFITGDDLGAIDDVAFINREELIPKLQIRRISTRRLRVSWPAEVLGFILQSTPELSGSEWQTLETTANEFEFEPGVASNFFRLVKF